MGVTSHDVARMAGVSQPTVSRALRGEPGVSHATREKVLRAARTLAYVPSETGRSLSTRATRRIGIVAAELTNPFYPELVEPTRDRLAHAGFRTVLVTDRVEEPVELAALVDGSLDGVVLTTTVLGSPLPHELGSRGIPCVLVNRDVGGPGVDSCVMDNRTGALDVAHLLTGLGHRRIGAIFGPDYTSTGRDRETGFREGLSERGVPLPRRRVRRGDFAYETGYTALLELLDARDRPTAVFCGNDVIAMGACNAAAAQGVRVPGELTIVGFDDIAMASWPVFSLTSVRYDLAAMATTAVRLLTDRIKQFDRPAERVVLPPSLVLRGTHGPPPS